MLEGIILAAGYGTRLLPITKLIPKPIVPLCDRPLILYVMERMHKYGIKKFFVNVHYKKDMVIKTIKRSLFKDITEFQIEDEILLTGGGLCGLLSMTYGENALVHNVDIVEEFDYDRLRVVHEEEKNDITWVLTKQRGNVLVDDKNIIGFGKDGLTFTGVGIYRKNVVYLMPEGRFSLIPWVLNMINEKKIKIGYVVENHFWVDAGTPDGLFRACVNMLDKEGKNIVINGRVEGDIGFYGHVYIGEDVKIKGSGIVKDAIILGKSSLNGNIDIKRRIIYDDLCLAF